MQEILDTGNTEIEKSTLFNVYSRRSDTEAATRRPIFNRVTTVIGWE